jgi:hypothetical protein
MVEDIKVVKGSFSLKPVLFISIIALIFISHSSMASFFKDAVDMADLSQLSPHALETLKDSEFKVFLETLGHAAEKVKANKAREELKSAESDLSAKNLRLQAAKKELKGIQEKSAGKKLTAAEETLRAAQKEYDFVKLFKTWKEKELDACNASVQKAKAAISVAEAERDLARVEKLTAEKIPSAGKYMVAEFKKQLEKKKKTYEAAADKEKSKISEAEKFKREYERLSNR